MKSRKEARIERELANWGYTRRTDGSYFKLKNGTLSNYVDYEHALKWHRIEQALFIALTAGAVGLTIALIEFMSNI